jgi:hypothetical protein
MQLHADLDQRRLDPAKVALQVLVLLALLFFRLTGDQASVLYSARSPHDNSRNCLLLLD